VLIIPLTLTGKKVLKNMEKEYGVMKGKQVFYASEHKHPEWAKKR
jgi:hypothetical protein